MKIYTRTGDKGMTGLFGGPRVAKDDSLIEAYGTVDELNSVVGLAREALAAALRRRPAHQSTGEGPAATDPAADGLRDLDASLKRIQHELFDVGADLATPLDTKTSVTRVGPGLIDALESGIDAFDDLLEPLKQFILPGGTGAAAQLHLARTVCRRAERRTLSAGRGRDINPQVAIYLNRLSDWFFAAARAANALEGRPDVTWSAS